MILQRLWAESNPDPRSTAPVGVTRNMHGEEGNTGLGNEEQGWGDRGKRRDRVSRRTPRTWQEYLGTVTYSLPRVGSTGSAGVCSREWIYSANAADIGSGLVGSQSWGQPLGKAANASRKRRRKRAGAGQRAEGVGGEGTAEAMLGTARPRLCVTHLHLRAVPFLRANNICQQSYQCFRQRSCRV